MDRVNLSICTLTFQRLLLTLLIISTGEVMRDELIRAQMNAFLVAGHETTSGMLSFTIIWMLQHPETYRRAQDEVDQILGSESVTLKHIRELKYCMACIHESLRLAPTAPIITKIPHQLKGTKSPFLVANTRLNQQTAFPWSLASVCRYVALDHNTKWRTNNCI